MVDIFIFQLQYVKGGLCLLDISHNIAFKKTALYYELE